MTNDIKRVVKQLFRKRKRSAVPIYLKRFETIQKLIDQDLLGFDFKQKLVVLDSSIHALYLNDDRKYAAFFDTLQAYMNAFRGALGIEEFIDKDDRINFMVVLKQYIGFDLETGDFFSPAKETVSTLLVGYYQDGKVDYAVYEPPKETEE